ncbi:MAG: metallophosphoesterase [Acidobacteriota bacterium]
MSETRDSSGPPRSLPVAPLVLFVAVWLGIPSLIVGFFVQSLLPGGWVTVLVVLAGFFVPVRTLLRGFGGLSYPSAAVRLFVLRPFWYAMLFMPLLAGCALLGALSGLVVGSPVDWGRMALGGASALLVLLGISGYVGARRVVVRELEVSIPRLPEAFDGLRVVQISDLHVGPHSWRFFLSRVERAVREAGPDLIAITGDQVDDFARDVELFNDAFAGLVAPLGVYVVAGNHDIYAGWPAVAKGLGEAGMTVLVNDAAPVERGGERLWVAGTGDPAARGWPLTDGRSAAPDLERTLAKVPEDEAVLVLAHNPALWPALVQRGADLTLSGHTHYGQLAIPSLGWSMASPFLQLAMGWHRKGRSLLYINPGSNFWGIPFRLGTPPEVTILTLRRGEEAAIRETGRRPADC